MSNREVLTTSIPWFRTRLFWGVVIGALIAWGIGYFVFEVYSPTTSGYNNFINLSISLGALPLAILLTNVVHELLQILLYYIIMTVLAYMALRNERVKLLYSILFVILFVLGNVLGLTYFSGLLLTS
jgi:hypothetical protein